MPFEVEADCTYRVISVGDPFGEVSKQLRPLKHFTSWLWFVPLFYPQGRLITQCGQRLDQRALGMWKNQSEAKALGWMQDKRPSPAQCNSCGH